VGGGVDISTMTKADASDVGNDNVPAVNVKSVAIDDIIQNKVRPTIDYAESNSRSADGKIDKLFLLKVDKQGHEPSVFSGLKQSIREHKIDFIMTEYWPKGIDFMNDTMGPETECQKSIEMMQLMIDAGYTLYTTSVTSHRNAPQNTALKAIHAHNHLRKPEIQTPIDSLRAHCMWFYDLERDPKYLKMNPKRPTSENYEYKMGYWTDVLAVAPGAKLGKVPVTTNGEIIASHLNSNSN